MVDCLGLMPIAPSSPPLYDHNFKILEENGMDLDKIIRADPSSPLFYGSEFKPVSILEPLFKHHPKWTEMKSRLLNGSEYKMEDLGVILRSDDRFLFGSYNQI
jgi:hypothetical protein